MAEHDRDTNLTHKIFGLAVLHDAIDNIRLLYLMLWTACNGGISKITFIVLDEIPLFSSSCPIN